MDRVHYELEVRRAETGTWHFNQRQKTLEKAREHESIVRCNMGDYFDDVRIVEVKLVRKVVDV